MNPLPMDGLLEWLVQHGLDPQQTRSVAIEIDASRIPMLHADVYQLDPDGHRIMAEDMVSAVEYTVTTELKCWPPLGAP